MRSKPTLKNQSGLASVEFCLIAPVLALFVYLFLHSSKSMLLHEKRIIAARNSAYLTETYYRENNNTPSLIVSLRGSCTSNPCNPTNVDSAISLFDSAMQAAEVVDDTLRDIDETINNYNDTMADLGIDANLEGVNPLFPKNMVSTTFGKSLVSYSERTTQNAMDTTFKDYLRDSGNQATALALDLANTYTAVPQYYTVGTAISDYHSPVGKHAKFGVVMRHRHFVDFADSLDIPTEPSLKDGYKRAMWEKLKPDHFYQSTFPGLGKHGGFLPQIDFINNAVNNNSQLAANATPPPGTYTGQGSGPADDPECSSMNNRVQSAKDVVGQYGSCLESDPSNMLQRKRRAWLELATARSTYHQRCWAGGNPGHQQAEAAAWRNNGRCERYISGDFSR